MGGLLVDSVFEPLISAQPEGGLWVRLFGSSKGSGAAMLFAVIGVVGVAVCLIFGALLRKHKWSENK